MICAIMWWSMAGEQYIHISGPYDDCLAEKSSNIDLRLIGLAILPLIGPTGPSKDEI